MHGEGIQIIVAQILMYASVISLSDQFVTILLCRLCGLVMAGAAHAAALTDHALNEVLRQSTDLQQSKGLFAFRNAAALCDLNIGIFTGLLETFQNSCCHAAAVAKPLAVNACFLTGICFRLKLHALCAHNRTDLTEGQYIVCVTLDAMLMGFRFLGNAGPDKYGNRLGILRLQQSGNAAHG